ncbi:MAG: hypothetical protein ACOZNI_22225 [Myxococcota bacterium]
MHTHVLLALLFAGPAHAHGPSHGPPPSSRHAPAPAAPALAPETRAAADAALAAYERVRIALGKDSLEGVPQAAEEMATHARAARETAPTALHATLEGFAREADALKAATDLAAARTAFAEASRKVIELGAASPQLTEGRYVYVCPMREPFGKWVQTTLTLENPYMGSKMPGCGARTTWTP